MSLIGDLLRARTQQSYSGWEQNWSSQEWKADELMDGRTERPVVCSKRSKGTAIHHWRRRNRIGFVVGTRSFLDRVNDQECSCLQHWSHLYSWKRISQTSGIPSRIQKITMKQMFDTSAKLVSEQDEIYGVKTIYCLGKLFMEAFVFDWR